MEICTVNLCVKGRGTVHMRNFFCLDGRVSIPTVRILAVIVWFPDVVWVYGVSLGRSSTVYSVQNIP